MLLHTHYLLGHKIFDQLPKEDKCYIDFKSFIKGNLLPDIQSKYRFFHNFSQSKDLLTQIVAWLPYYDSPEKRSEQLGVLIHFISDFFCAYHTREAFIQKPLRTHFFYELRLHYFYQFFFTSYEVKMSLDSLNEKVDFFQWLWFIQEDYLSYKPSYSKDLTYAIKTSVIVANYFIQKMKKCHQLVA